MKSYAFVSPFFSAWSERDGIFIWKKGMDDAGVYARNSRKNGYTGGGKQKQKQKQKQK